MEGVALGTVNWLVLPVLGGYWFQYKFTLTHYRAERLTPQRLVFHAGLWAIMLVALARAMVSLGEFATSPHSALLESWLFALVVAFSLVTLCALASAGLERYWPKPTMSAEETESRENQESDSYELVRLGVGMAIVVILLFIIWAVYIYTPAPAQLTTEFHALVVTVILAILTAWHHHFINRYMEFPFARIALRIGIFGIVASLALVFFAYNYPALLSYWDLLVHTPGSGLPVLACGLGLVLWWPLNILCPYQAANTRLHEANGTTALDRLLYQASLAQHLLCLSMKDGKVYIGYIQELPSNPEDRNSYFEILPVHSGYRDKDTRQMKLTTFYESAYEELVNSKADEEAWLLFLKVLKIDDIQSAGRFDPEAYVKFREEQRPQSTTEESLDATG